MSNPLARLVRNTVRWGYFALPVLALLTAWVAVLYRRAFAVGVLSDGWVLLEIGSRGLREAPFVLLSYHTIPVTNFFMAVLWKLFGLREGWYQLVNLGELVLVGWLLYLLGCALFRQPRVGLLASLLFLANASFYEVPFWPTVGNFQSLTALLYLAGVFAVHRAFSSARRWRWLFVFSPCGTAAFFAYEPAVSVFAVGVFYAAVMPVREGEPWPVMAGLQRAGLVIVASLPAMALILGSKLYTAGQGYSAMFLPTDWASLKLRTYLLVRGCVAIFSLRGADHKLYSILTFGTSPPRGSGLFTALFCLWVAILAGGALLLLWQGRSRAVRLLTLWFAAHVLLVSAATPIVSRHFYLAALPAALLSAWLIWRAAEAAAAWLRPGPGSPAAALLAFFGLALLASLASTDLSVAATVHQEASRATRQVVERVRQATLETGAPPRVALVNMPTLITQDGIGAFAFVNGLHQLLALSTAGQVTQPELFYTYNLFRDGLYANASQPLTVAELDRMAREPGTLVLRYDPGTRTVVEVDRRSWRLPVEYTAESAPFLNWERGSWPWMRAYPGQPLELPLDLSGERSWVAMRYLRGPGVKFTVSAGAAGAVPLFESRPGPEAAPAWPTAAFAVPVPPSGPAVLTIEAETEAWLAGLRSFAPPESYDPENSPFLIWTARPAYSFVVTDPLRLPVRCPASPCTVRMEYLAQRGRDFVLGIEGGARQAFTFGGMASSEWRSAEIDGGAGGTAVVSIEPAAGSQLLVRALSSTRPPG